MAGQRHATAVLLMGKKGEGKGVPFYGLLRPLGRVEV